MHKFHRNSIFGISTKRTNIIDTTSLPTEFKVCDVCKDKFFCSLDDLQTHML